MSNILIYFVQKLAHGNWSLQYGLLGDTKLSQIHFVRARSVIQWSQSSRLHRMALGKLFVPLCLFDQVAEVGKSKSLEVNGTIMQHSGIRSRIYSWNSCIASSRTWEKETSLSNSHIIRLTIAVLTQTCTIYQKYS